MNAALVDLYQRELLRHAGAARGVPAGATHRASASNVLCGDRVVWAARLEQDEVRLAGWDGDACAVAAAAAVLLTTVVTGQPRAAAVALARRVSVSLGGDLDTLPEAFAPLRGLSAFPVRRQCAVLPVRALLGALSPDGPLR